MEQSDTQQLVASAMLGITQRAGTITVLYPTCSLASHP